MKRKELRYLPVLIGLLMLIGCTTAGGAPEIPPEEEPPYIPEDPGVEEPAPPVSEFSLLSGDGVLTLRAWEDELPFREQLGEPEDAELIQLEHADTFTGSWLRTETYPGLTLQWFSPEGDGQRFWLMNMTTVDPAYSTVRGIAVGSSREDMELAYPEIRQTLDGRTDLDNSSYEWVDEAEYNYGRFEVENGVVRQIQLEHLFP